MTSPDHEAVEREMHIAARPEIVFSFFTDPEKMVRWLGIRATLNARPGGVCHIHINEREMVGGEYLENAVLESAWLQVLETRLPQPAGYVTRICHE